MGVLSSRTHEGTLATIANHPNLYRTCTNHVATPQATPGTRRTRVTQWRVAHYHSPLLPLNIRNKAHSLSTKSRSVDATVSATPPRRLNATILTVAIQLARVHRTPSVAIRCLIARQRNVLKLRSSLFRNQGQRYHSNRQRTTNTLSITPVSQCQDTTIRKQSHDNGHHQPHKVDRPAGRKHRTGTPTIINKAFHRGVTVPKARAYLHHHLLTIESLIWLSTLWPVATGQVACRHRSPQAHPGTLSEVTCQVNRCLYLPTARRIPPPCTVRTLLVQVIQPYLKR